MTVHAPDPGTQVEQDARARDWDLLLALAREDDPVVVAAGLRARAGGDLVDRYAPLLLAGRRGVVAQLGQSLDGCIATRSGDANFVTGDADREHLHRLRALVDAVVVGPGTVDADDPQLTVRAVTGPNPVRVVLDPRANLHDRAVLADPRTVWIRGDLARDPVAVLAGLRDAGLRRVLVEGGGCTVSDWVAAGVVDRLYLTVAPLVIGRGGRRGLALPDVEPLRDCLRPDSRRHLLGEDVCFELDLRG
ncbi:RibD family protein [Kineococcus rhizosphaerae]|uniref:Riboflavin biosynthesis pyrimidine reductase n=1 Tax=Kineococcus rhizosphaerae TaxID=559628 RepID=A0A2T0R9L0_9ACTN|nr:RibD family protein [Kineococcus rhizosphaerae]PRY17843.1 riboflavin biosynthesis pyrimidine reductase [Kineococcus rhizosphaerae]